MMVDRGKEGKKGEEGREGKGEMMVVWVIFGVGTALGAP